jgi:hypothetical protein
MAAIAAAGGGGGPVVPAAPAAPAAPFRGPAADSVLGERCIDVLPIVSASGFAAEVSHCRWLCGETWRAGDLGATNDMLVRSAEIQCGARAAREKEREDFEGPAGFGTLRGSTQLIHAARRNDLPRVRQLVQLGAPLKLTDQSNGWSALLWACREGFERVAEALLNGKYEGRGAEVDLVASSLTPLMWACVRGHEGVVRLLLARSARQELQSSNGYTALHWAVDRNTPGVVAALCGAAGAAAALALRDRDGRTPLALAIHSHCAACEAVLRAYGAPV